MLAQTYPLARIRARQARLRFGNSSRAFLIDHKMEPRATELACCELIDVSQAPKS